MTDTELLDKLDEYVRENKYILIHNTKGSDDPDWPKGYSGGGLGLLPYSPRTVRDALKQCFEMGIKRRRSR